MNAHTHTRPHTQIHQTHQSAHVMYPHTHTQYERVRGRCHCLLCSDDSEADCCKISRYAEGYQGYRLSKVHVHLQKI